MAAKSNKTIKKRKTPRAPFLHREVEYKLAKFLQNFPPRVFNRQFRNMFFDYMSNDILGHAFIDMRIEKKELFESVGELMEVLDEAETHWTFRDVDDIIDKYRGR